ncbi:MAG: double-strand break repair protein AddB [Paracoccaceae bacterium]
MFAKSQSPRIFGLPPGVNFSRSFVDGLKSRLTDYPPEKSTTIKIYVNSNRMLQKIKAEFTNVGASILPNLSTLNHLIDDFAISPSDIVDPLSLRLELAQIISKFIEIEPSFGSQNSCFDLADSLANLIKEIHEEGLSLEVLTKLNLDDYSKYWQRNRKFFILIKEYLDDREIVSHEQSQWNLIDELEKKWAVNPPTHPIMVVGSTGSKGITQKFIKLISTLPQGAVVLPGVDFDTPESVWDALGKPKKTEIPLEDHPQYRLKEITSKLNIKLSQIERWTETKPSIEARNKLVSLALQPAPITDTWLEEGPKLKNIREAISDVTILEAPSDRVEALAISMGIRKALEQNKTCLVITPNRVLARKIAAALKQWNLDADDAAGIPLSLSVIGRLFLKVSNLQGNSLNSLNFIELFKHPFVNLQERGIHLKSLRKLELDLVRGSPYFPDNAQILEWSNSFSEKKELSKWAIWVCECLDKIRTSKLQTVHKHLKVHTEIMEHLISGPNSLEAKQVWARPDGRELILVIDQLQNSSKVSGLIGQPQYSNLIYFLLKKSTVRVSYIGRSDIMIWGTQETRVSDADIVFLAGLNDGVWPPLPTPDPWINRAMRIKAKLLLPEHLIGLSAHDFQQAIASKEVWLTRSSRDSEAETLPSRWLNRLFNLIEGLSKEEPFLLNSMRARGEFWLELVKNFEKPNSMMEPATRPSPMPPISCRPKTLPVTQIEKLIRDPYTIYAKYILNLRPIGSLYQTPDSALRGQIIHSIMEKFIILTKNQWPNNPFTLLDQLSDEILQRYLPKNSTRLFWKRKISSFSENFLYSEEQRRMKGTPLMLEERGSIEIEGTNFQLTGVFDRIDRDPEGNLTIFDYKTGVIPSYIVQKYFDKQLLLLALIIHKGGIKKLKSTNIKEAFYIDLSSNPKEYKNSLSSQNLDVIFADFKSLILEYNNPNRGYLARRAVFETRWDGDYDHLSRFGEWDHTQLPKPELSTK